MGLISLQGESFMHTVAHDCASSAGLTRRPQVSGSQMHMHRSRHSKMQICARLGYKLASTAYEVAFTSEQPYYMLPEKKSMLQRISVVKVRAAWLDQ